MRKLSFLLKLAVLLTMSVLVLLPACVWIAAFHTQRRAESFLADLVALDLGKSKLSEALKIANDHDGFIFDYGHENKSVSRDMALPSACTEKACDLGFRFDSFVLRRFHLGYQTALVGFIEVRDGVVTTRQASFGTWSGRQSEQGWDDSYQIDVYECSPRAGGPCQYFLSGLDYTVRWHSTAPRYAVYFTSQAPPYRRGPAWALNLSCFTRLGGCRSRHELLPGVPEIE